MGLRQAGVASRRDERVAAGGALAVGGPASPASAVRLAGLYLRTGWRLLLAVGLGILVAVTLLGTVPLYTGLVSSVELQAAIRGQPVEARNVEIQVREEPLLAGAVAAHDRIVRALGAQYLAATSAPAVTRYFTADPLPMVALGGVAVDPRNVALLLEAFDYAQALPHMHLSAGAVPRAAPAGGPPGALITDQMAADLHLAVGDTITAAPSAASAARQELRVVGIWSPRDAGDPFWNGRTFGAASTFNGPTTYPILVDQDAFLGAFAALPAVQTVGHWIYYTEPQRVTTADEAAVGDRVARFRTQVQTAIAAQGTQSLVLSALDQIVRDDLRRAGLLALPLYVVVAQIVGLALLFVGAAAGLLVERQAAEIAALKSRGSSSAQIVAGYTLLGLALGVLAAAAGPWLARSLAVALVRGLIPAPTLAAAGANTAYLFGLAPPGAAAVPAAAGALLGVGAVAFAAARHARRDVLAFRRAQGRASGRSFWRRYYVDVQLAGVCALAYVDLDLFGGVGVRERLGDAAGSPLLLAAPALLLLAGALLLLRVFPLVVGLGVRLAARGRGSTAVLALAQVARSPAGPSRLALLLALAVGLGLFALTFDASLGRNAADQAAYQAGADLRLVEDEAVPPVVDARYRARLGALPGVRAVAPVYRDQFFTTSDQGANSFDVLAVDPASWSTAAATTSWRADYAGLPLATLMARMQAHRWVRTAAQRAGATPAGDPSHPIWAIVSQTFADAVQARAGDRFEAPLGGAGGGETATFVVGAIVSDFPTLYPTAATDGFVVLDLDDLFGAYTAMYGLSVGQIGPNEYWLRTTDDPARHAALARALDGAAGELDIARVTDRRALETELASNPVQAGIGGLLLVGAALAAALALLGGLLQAGVAVRQRAVQLAVLRTLGLTGGQLARVLLGEQLVVYASGLLGGSVLGLLLARATLSYLAFSAGTLDPAEVGVPPYVLAVDPQRLLLFYLALAGVFALALLLGARYAARLGLGQTLRLGDD